MCKIVATCQEITPDNLIISLQREFRFLMSSQSDEFNRCVTRKLPQLVKMLRPSRLLDHLRASELVTLEDCHQLRQCRTEADRSRMLLYDILPPKGDDGLHRFCGVLKDAGQQEILNVMQKEGVESRESDPQQQHLPTPQLPQNRQVSMRQRVRVRIETVCKN